MTDRAAALAVIREGKTLPDMQTLSTLSTEGYLQTTVIGDLVLSPKGRRALKAAEKGN